MPLFHHDGSSSNHTCPMPTNLATPPQKDFISGWTFQHFNMVLSGACAALTLLLIFILMMLHATHFSRPNEQVKIMKICLLLPLYSICSFLSIAFPNAFASLLPWVDVFQSIALANFFLLLCDFVSPNHEQRENFFAALEVSSRKAGKEPKDGIAAYRKKWIMIFQYPIVAILVAIFTDITEAVNKYCLESSKPYFAHLWLSIVINISLGLAVFSILKFYSQLKNDLKHHKPLAKLLAFKGIIALVFIERIIFWILRSTKVLKESSTLTYADVNMGIQTMIVCIEMIPFALFFYWAYDVKPYLLSKSRPLVNTDAETNYSGKPFEYPVNGFSYQGGFLGYRAWLAVLNPMEILRGIAFAFSMATQLRSRRG